MLLTAEAYLQPTLKSLSTIDSITIYISIFVRLLLLLLLLLVPFEAETCSIAQASLRLVANPLPQPPSVGIVGVYHHTQLDPPSPPISLHTHYHTCAYCTILYNLRKVQSNGFAAQNTDPRFRLEGSLQTMFLRSRPWSLFFMQMYRTEAL